MRFVTSITSTDTLTFGENSNMLFGLPVIFMIQKNK